jgi:hypothetical protein
MLEGKSMSAGRGKVGGASVEAKQSAMTALVTEQIVSIKWVSELSSEEYAKYTKGGTWALHSVNTAGWGLYTAKGVLLTVLSHTMLVYALQAIAGKMSSQIHALVQSRVCGKILTLGVEGVSETKWDGGFSGASIGTKGEDVQKALRASIVSKAREAKKEKK